MRKRERERDREQQEEQILPIFLSFFLRPDGWKYGMEGCVWGGEGASGEPTPAAVNGGSVARSQISDSAKARP